MQRVENLNRRFSNQPSIIVRYHATQFRNEIIVPAIIQFLLLTFSRYFYNIKSYKNFTFFQFQVRFKADDVCGTSLKRFDIVQISSMLLHFNIGNFQPTLRRCIHRSCLWQKFLSLMIILSAIYFQRYHLDENLSCLISINAPLQFCSDALQHVMCNISPLRRTIIPHNSRWLDIFSHQVLIK